jgi:hypothetical protein
MHGMRSQGDSDVAFRRHSRAGMIYESELSRFLQWERRYDAYRVER